MSNTNAERGHARQMKSKSLLYISNILPQTEKKQDASFGEVTLQEPCQACGYSYGNVLALPCDRRAVRCGKCDVYQFSFAAPKQQRRRAG